MTKKVIDQETEVVSKELEEKLRLLAIGAGLKGKKVDHFVARATEIINQFFEDKITEVLKLIS